MPQSPPPASAPRRSVLAFAALSAVATGCAASAREVPSVGDAAAAPAPGRGTPVDGVRAERIAVHFHDPSMLASTLRDIYGLDGHHASDALRAVLVDDATGELVVIGSEAGLASVRSMLGPALASDPSDRDGVEVLPLAQADADALAGVIRPVLPRGARLVPDRQANALVVSGSPAERAAVLGLARSLDVARATD